MRGRGEEASAAAASEDFALRPPAFEEYFGPTSFGPRLSWLCAVGTGPRIGLCSTT